MNDPRIIFLEKRVRQLNLLLALLVLTVLFDSVALIFVNLTTSDLKDSLLLILAQRNPPSFSPP